MASEAMASLNDLQLEQTIHGQWMFYLSLWEL
jgi:hypothetical protein